MPADARPALPDVNAETHPFEVVQQALDRVAYFGLYAVPRTPGTDAWLTPNGRKDYFGINGGYGLDVRCDLHRFDSGIDMGGGVKVRQVVGQDLGSLRSKFLFSRGEPRWIRGLEPRTLCFDSWKPEHFVLLDTRLSLGNSANVLMGYGIGRTFPVMIGGRPCLAACAVADLFGGEGEFRSCVGTLVLNGEMTPELGFQGHASIRIPDADGRLSVAPTDSGPVPGMALGADRSARLYEADPVAYLCMRGEKSSPDVLTRYGPPPGGGQVSLVTPGTMREVRFDAVADARLRTQMVIGPRVSDLIADVHLDILAPPGTPDSPNPFTTRNEYSFVGSDDSILGSVTAEVEFGRSFALALPSLPGQAAIRYGGYGLVVGGTGAFEGARGTLTINSAIGVAPHALSMLNVLRLYDPDGRWQSRRSASGDRVCQEGPWSAAFPEIAGPTYMFEPRWRGSAAEGSTPAGSSPASSVPGSSGPEIQTAAAAAPMRAGGASPLPDLNAETNPFPLVQATLDEASFLHCLCTPAESARRLRTGDGKGVRGIEMVAQLRPFEVSVAATRRGLIAHNRAGAGAGTLRQRWLFMPDGCVGDSDWLPQETAFDPTRSQRFVMVDTAAEFGSGLDGFGGFGTGETMPMGRCQVLVGAVGDMRLGTGRLAGAAATFVLNGKLSEDRGFEGSLLLRVVDGAPELRADSLGHVESVIGGCPGLTFMVFRGQKRSADERTELLLQAGRPSGFSLEQELRTADLAFAARDRLNCRVDFGAVIGGMESQVFLDLGNLSTPTANSVPIPFTSRNRFYVSDPGGRVIGSFVAEGGEGKTYALRLASLPGQQALRFGAFQRLTHGTGVFEGARGVLTDNSAVGVAPHATATMYVACIADGERSFKGDS